LACYEFPEAARCSPSHSEGQDAREYGDYVVDQQSGGIKLVGIEQGNQGDKQVAAHHIGYVEVVVRVEGVEEYDAPEGVQQDDGQSLGSRGDEKKLRSAFQAHGSRATLQIGRYHYREHTLHVSHSPYQPAH